MVDLRNLKKRRQGWFCRLAVPMALRGAVGKQELVVSLKTRDIGVARQRRHAALAELQTVLSAAAGIGPQVLPESIVSVARALLQSVRDGQAGRGEAGAAFDVAVDRQLDKFAKKNGVDPDDGHPIMPQDAVDTIRLGYSVMAGDNVTLLSDAIRTYLGETSERVTASTLDTKTRQLGAV